MYQKRTYYIDYENTGKTPFGRMILGPKDRCVIFWSEKSFYFSLEYAEMLRGKVRFVKTGVGKNAMDFQILAYLMVHRKKDRMYFIVSNDHGYDHAISMLEREGICNVKRLSSDLSENKDNAENAPEDNPVSAAENGPFEASMMEILNSLSDGNTEDRLLDALPKNVRGECAAILRMSPTKTTLHGNLCKRFGMTEGRALYLHLRSLRDK